MIRWIKRLWHKILWKLGINRTIAITMDTTGITDEMIKKAFLGK